MGRRHNALVLTIGAVVVCVGLFPGGGHEPDTPLSLPPAAALPNTPVRGLPAGPKSAVAPVAGAAVHACRSPPGSGNAVPLADAAWEAVLRDGRVTRVHDVKELSVRLVLRHPDVPRDMYGWCKVTDNWAGEQWGREVLTYHFDRMLGFYLTPPVVYRQLDFPGLSKGFGADAASQSLLQKTVDFAEGVRRKRMKTQPSLRGPVRTAMIGWMEGVTITLKSLDVPPDSLSEPLQRAFVEITLLMYLTSCNKIARSHFFSGVRWLMIDNDRCFRERELSMEVPAALNLCRFPRDVILFLRRHAGRVGAALRDRVAAAEPAGPIMDWVQEMERHNLVRFANTDDRAAAILRVVERCEAKPGAGRPVFYDREEATSTPDIGVPVGGAPRAEAPG